MLAAKRMGPPVISAMLTTVAAFLPLFMVKGIIGGDYWRHSSCGLCCSGCLIALMFLYFASTLPIMGQRKKQSHHGLDAILMLVSIFSVTRCSTKLCRRPIGSVMSHLLLPLDC